MDANIRSSVPPSEGWHTFDALDLENKILKPENCLQNRLDELDIAEKKPDKPVSVTAQKMDAYAQKRAQDVKYPLFPAWSKIDAGIRA